jgi:hypothetical protein
MTARTTYEASVKTAESAKVATLIAAETTKQTTVDASLSVVGYTLQSGNYASLAAAVKSANAAKLNSVFAAEQARQAALAAARDTLRDSGDRTSL